MKKTSKATTTTPATPAQSPAKKSSAKAPKTATFAPIEAKPAAAPAVKASPAPATPTKIVAKIDVGFGNTLFIRGEGPGLSWEKGIPLDCVADDQWALSVGETSRPVVFKFLVNDLTWSVGEDYIVQPGATIELVPVF